MKARLARILLILSLLAFVAFNILPWWTDEDSLRQGWRVWIEVYEGFVDGHFTGIDAITGVGFVSFALVVVASPFTAGALRKSRLIWWLLFLFSGICLFTVSGMILYYVVADGLDFSKAGSGLRAFMAAQVLNFTGLLLLPRAAIPSAAESPGEPTLPG